MHIRIMGRLLYILMLLLSATSLSAQTWYVPPSAPVASWRHDDIAAAPGGTCLLVNLDGYVYRSVNAGLNWFQVTAKPGTGFRCVAMLTASHAFAGNLGPGSFGTQVSDTVPLYETQNGGVTWTPVSNISGPMPTGLCGMRRVNDSCVVALGRIGGPAHFLRTTDAGQSWVSRDMNALFGSLVDCHFIHPDTGWVIGADTGSDFFHQRAQVAYTTDGGLNWSLQYIDPDTATTCWKIDFPSSQIGYISIETPNDSVFILKTTDGGINWERKLVSDTSIWLQGMGFINDSVGWTGSLGMLMTGDGGDSWRPMGTDTLYHFNRFRRLGDSLALACGARVWRMSDIPSGLHFERPAKLPEFISLSPNPTSAGFTIEFCQQGYGTVSFDVYDLAGRHVESLFEMMVKGRQRVVIDGRPRWPVGLYFLVMRCGDYRVGKYLILE